MQIIDKNPDKIDAFIEFASDTEDMIFKKVKTPSGQWKAVTTREYDPNAIIAVKRYFL